MSRTALRLAAVALLSALSAACASTPTPGPTASLAAASAAVPPAERLKRAVDHLGRGEAEAAHAELAQLLTEKPGDTTAKKLLDEIERDPKAMLGTRSYAYKIKPGETLSTLSARFLGDPLLFYALARYNGIAAPNSAEVGRTLQIPGFPKVAPPVKRAAAPPPPAPVDPERAGKLRRAALEAMTKGSIDQAVALLRQAQPLDPANQFIKIDLDRATRIQATVKAQ